MKLKTPMKILSIFGIILFAGLTPSSSYITIIDSLSTSKGSLILPNMEEIPGGEDTQIQYGPTGNLHVIYYERFLGTNSLKYSVKHNDQWSIPHTILENTNHQLTFDFSVDLNDKIHLSYGDSFGNITYLTNSKGFWEDQALISKNNKTLSSEINLGADSFFNLATSTEFSPQNKSLTFIYQYPTLNHTVINQTVYINSSQSGEPSISNINLVNKSICVNVSKFDSTLIETSPSMVSDSNGTIHIVYEGLWNNPQYPDEPIWDVFYTTFTKNYTSYKFSSLTNETTIINSTTNETQSILTNTTTYISNRTGWFSNPIQLSNSTPSLQYLSPIIAKGNNNQLHVSWIQSINNTEYMLELGSLNKNHTVWNSKILPFAVPLSEIKYSMVIDSLNTCHLIFKKLELISNLTRFSNLTYFSNHTGYWKYSQLIEPFYSLSDFDIKLDPINNRPFVMVSGKITENSNLQSFMLKFVEGAFGNELGYLSSINGKQITLQTKKDDFITPVDINLPAFDSSSQYIQAFSKRLVSLSLTLENLQSYDQSLSLNIVLRNVSIIQLAESNYFTQNLSSLAAHSYEEFLWEFEFIYAGSRIIALNIERDGSILYCIQFIVIIKESFSMTPNFLIFSGLITVFSVGYWYLRKKS
ncbi:hypothetical protein NEF87_004484 [Candidatus Lokiarchaeum ossiferum]|uniref:Uncharacterized protein n=1 Tax=Candidatus Lokiarchaeum ossiferum TaxID=2951803 RepID=A0ABY6I054_9ARCH|nr:hypothetical protein NEF87_004484 [Candidatus Lokiarchaeum sp. B-35]